MKYFLLLLFITLQALAQPQGGIPPGVDGKFGPVQNDSILFNTTGDSGALQKSEFDDAEKSILAQLKMNSQTCSGSKVEGALEGDTFLEVFDTLFMAHNLYLFHQTGKMNPVDCPTCQKQQVEQKPLANSLSPYLACVINTQNTVLKAMIHDKGFLNYMLSKSERTTATSDRIERFFQLYMGE